MVLRELALCAGVGMLSEGCRLAFEHLGVGFRTVCYVEREAFAAAQLVALMEAQCMDAAPIWSDLVTFRGGEWRGKVDCITAGFPCQPHSVAGKRAGLDDERWIWPDIARIVGDVRPRFVLLENVPGLVTTGGLDACIGDLAAIGYNAEWALLSASAVGASHERERLFIFAWLADTGCEHQHVQQRLPRPREHSGSGGELGDAARDGRRQRRAHTAGRGEGTIAPEERAGLADTCAIDAMAHAERAERRPLSRPGIRGSEGRDTERQATSRAGNGDSVLAVTNRASSQRGGQRSDKEGRQEPDGYAGLAGGSLFAPGPSDERWPAILARWPFLAPALESGVRGVADGLAVVLDDARSHQLRATGNGVVAIAAACAYVQLARRAGIMKQRDLFERGAA